MKRRGLVAIAAFVLLSLGTCALTVLLKPETTAYAGECVRRVDGALTNVCETDVVVALCRDASPASRDQDPCVYETLTPYAVFTRTLETTSEGAPYTLACHAPFEPEWRRSQGNYQRFEKACRKPDKASGQTF
ncbi:MAG: hypothetical protein WA989_05630 [Henriciella sp.]|uniref:hypothetical protein n=1 Tax=Henriciella sp. TaxID=1968823 RepID=UPI003C76F680